MQPLQRNLRLSDAKHNGITLAAAAAGNLDAAIPLRSADTVLQSAIELRTTAPQIAAILQLQNRISTPKRKNDDFEALLKEILKEKSSMPKYTKSAANAPFATSCSHYNATYNPEMPNTIVLR